MQAAPGEEGGGDWLSEDQTDPSSVFLGWNQTVFVILLLLGGSVDWFPDFDGAVKSGCCPPPFPLPRPPVRPTWLVVSLEGVAALIS